MTARVGWPDVAKGVCIILVVLWHVVTKHAIGLDGAGAITEGWARLNAQLLPLRMPLFFLISGMFAGRAVSAPSGSSWRRRAGRLALVYVVWVLIQTIALAITPEFDTARATDGWQLLAQLTISPTNLWYLLALAVYLVVARLVRQVPTGIVLPLAFALAAVAASGILPDLGNLWQVLQNLFFFLAGLRLRSVVERFAAASGVLSTVMLGLAYVVAVGAVGVLGMRQWPGIWPLLAIVAVAFGVAACALLDRHVDVIARPLRWVGRRTLPIYVIHMVPLALIDGALRGSGLVATPLVEAVWPPLLTALVIAICLAVHALIVRVGLGMLFDPLLVTDRLTARVRERRRLRVGRRS